MFRLAVRLGAQSLPSWSEFMAINDKAVLLSLARTANIPMLPTAVLPALPSIKQLENEMQQLTGQVSASLLEYVGKDPNTSMIKWAIKPT
eukprot:gene423-681_t